MGLLLTIAKGTTDPRFEFISQLLVLGIAYNLPASGGTGGTSTTTEGGRKFLEGKLRYCYDFEMFPKWNDTTIPKF